MDWLIKAWACGAESPAVIWRDATSSYGRLTELFEEKVESLRRHGVGPGACVGLAADFSPNAVATWFALSQLGSVAVPLSNTSPSNTARLLAIAGATHVLRVEANDSVRVDSITPTPTRNALLERLTECGESGLILFSSGTSGEPKAALHSMTRFLSRHRERRSRYRTLAFLGFDHIGGLNTMVYTLANLGCLVVPRSRATADVRRAIRDHGVELLPTSPSFLNLLLMSEGKRLEDLGSLKLITYGAEVMGDRTLKAAIRAFPGVRFQQTYGLTEVGILSSKSEDPGSLFVKLGGRGFETRVEQGCLHVRSATSMLGYLNAPDPFDGEGWFNTGDRVEQEGDRYRILGRTSDLINVGGLKVDPVQVEEIIVQLPEVAAAVVSSEAHPLLGKIVIADVQLVESGSRQDAKQRIVQHCKGKLAAFMVPSKVRIVEKIGLRRGGKKERK